ncbi:MAG TPA: septal ring lytic transglycosylase RlpA family protein [Chitinophagaceae bacterium]|nr:septal ring lytic transglycosylase RlpA family protein [Chitinophagaceae bacterium]
MALILPVQVLMAQGNRDISLRGHLVEHGIASYYAKGFNGQLTSTGDVFTNKGMTAASNTLPLGTVVKVTNLRNHKWVVVTINDRMNKHNKRTIDLTRKAAERLAMIHKGIARVKVEVVPDMFYKFYHLSADELVAYGQNPDNATEGAL